MYKRIILFCIQACLFKVALSFPQNNCNRPIVATGSAVTNVGSCLGSQTTTVPLVTEICPSLQFGDVNLAGDIPIEGCVRVCGRFPVYGVVGVEGAVPSAGSAVINTAGGLVTSVYDAGCGCRIC